MDTIAFDVALIPVIIGLVQVCKPFIFDVRWYPVMSLGISIVAEIIIGGHPMGTLVLQGVLVGLAASGLYSGAKAVSVN